MEGSGEVALEIFGLSSVILSFVKSYREALSPDFIASSIGVPSDQVEETLGELENEGAVVREGDEYRAANSDAWWSFGSRWPTR